MKVELGTFARECVETRFGANVRVGVLAALFHYTRRLKSGRKPIAPPGFYGDQADGERGVALDLELQVGLETQTALEDHAREHRLPLNQILTHAVFVYLADLEVLPDSMATSVALSPSGCE